MTSAGDLLRSITAVECSYSCRLVSSFRSKARKTMEAGDDQIRYGSNGVGTNFGVGVGEERPEGPRAGDMVLGEGQPAPPHQLGSLQ